jgi:hypothetical protein
MGTNPLADTGTVIVIAAVPAVVCVAGALLWRRFFILDPAERAFRSLARRLGLHRHQVALVRRLAEAARVTPIRVLVGPVAFDDGVRGLNNGLDKGLKGGLGTGTRRAKPAAINQLRTRLFETGPFQLTGRPNASPNADATTINFTAQNDQYGQAA